MPVVDRSRRRRRALPARATAVEVADERVLVLAPAPDGPRVQVGMVLPVLERVVDVTAHPAAARTALHDAAQRHATPPHRAEALARAALARASDDAGGWQPSAAHTVVGALGGAAYPLLAAAYDAGAHPVDELPRWAAPILRHPSARAAATEAFGPSATRPVVAALGRRFVEPPGAVVPLLPLALGLVGTDVLQPDRLARVVGCEVAPEAGDHLPDRATIATARRTLRRWGAARAERLLTDAATVEHGSRLLLELLRYAADLGDHGPRRVAPRLLDAHDQHRSAMATDPGPPRVAPPPAPAVRRAILEPPPAPARADPRHRALAPAAAPEPTRMTAAAPLPRTPALATVDRLAVGPLRLVVPRTVGDLERWSRLLANCLGGYGPVVLAGRSTIVGVERDGALRYALEIVAGGRVRQFVGPANRPVPADDRLATLAALADAGLVDRRGPDNAAWFTP